MKLFIIGGSGRLGTAFSRQLGARHEIIQPAPDAFDINDFAAVEAVFNAAKPDWVINCAAYTNTQLAEGEGAKDAYRVNAMAPAVLAGAAHRAGLPFMQISTDYVFGGVVRDAYVESDQPAPINVYGASKWLGELATIASHPGACVVRTSRLYGPKAASADSKKSFDEIVRELAAKEKTFSINHAEVSLPTLVDDLVLHLEKYLLADPKKAVGIFHAANSGTGCTWYEWACAIVDILGLDVTVTPRDPKAMPRPAACPSNSVLVSTKLPAMRPWREALASFLKG